MGFWGILFRGQIPVEKHGKELYQAFTFWELGEKKKTTQKHKILHPGYVGERQDPGLR